MLFPICLFLTTCTNPFADNAGGYGTFTVSFSATGVSRAAIYPPDLPDAPNPGAPTLAQLKIIIDFTPTSGGDAKTFNFRGNQEIKGRIEAGEYVVTMTVKELDDTLYAQGSASSNPITVGSGTNTGFTVNLSSTGDAAMPVINSQPVDGTYTQNATAKALTVSASVTKGTLSYQWYSNTSDSYNGMTPISGAASASYTPSTAAAGVMYYFCKVTNTDTSVLGNQTASINSDIAAVLVNSITDAQIPVISTQPVNGNYTQNTTAAALTVSASVTKGELSYQWYSNSSNSYTGMAAVSGATSASYTPSTASTGARYYYCKITNTDNSASGNKTSSIDSAIAAVLVNSITDAQIPVIGTQPANGNYTQNAAAAALTVSASVTSGVLSYQWYSNSSNSYTGMASISGATSASYRPSTASAGTRYYYCKITNTDNSVTGSKTASIDSAIAEVEVYIVTDAETPVISLQPVSAAYGQNGTAAALTVSASVSKGALSYQWYSSTSNSYTDMVSISGAASASYTPSTTATGSRYYFCKVTNTDTSVLGNQTASTNSAIAEVLVNSITDAQIPVISLQPVNGSYTQNATAAALTVSASVTKGTLSYQWYSNTANSYTGMTSISGATSSSYTPSTASTGTRYYYCKITNTDNTASGNKTASIDSAIAEVVVKTPYVWIDTFPGPTTAAYATLKEALDVITSAGTYTVRIGANQSLAPYTISGTGKDITLKANSLPIEVQLSSNGSLFTVNSGASLTLDNGVTLRGRNATANGADNTISLLQVNAGGSLVMKTGSLITGNTSWHYGGGVYITGSGASFTMQGGEISLNTTDDRGGGVVVSDGATFTMQNGEISRNIVSSFSTYVGGGGVIIEGPGTTFTMQSGKITGNTASSSSSAAGGGGVYIDGATFTMQGGEISANSVYSSVSTVGSGGGGVSVTKSGIFIMQGGEISLNTTDDIGGGVCVSDGATFTMVNPSAKISGNTAGFGGGLSVVGESTTFTMHSGKITGNIADYQGGGVYVNSYAIFTIGATFTMQGGEISGNTAAASGGGVFLQTPSTTFTMQGGEISGNTADYGGGVGVSYGPTFTMQGGEISKNTANYSGGGVYVDFDSYYGLSSFKKEGDPLGSPSGTIKGYGNDPVNGNAVKDSGGTPIPNQGHAVYVSSSQRKENTVGPYDELDSSVSGPAGGW